MTGFLYRQIALARIWYAVQSQTKTLHHSLGDLFKASALEKEDSDKAATQGLKLIPQLPSRFPPLTVI